MRRLRAAGGAAAPGSDLVHGQVDASVRDDAQHAGYVALVKGTNSFPPQDLCGAVSQSRELTRFSECQTGFQHLQGGKKRSGDTEEPDHL